MSFNLNDMWPWIHDLDRKVTLLHSKSASLLNGTSQFVHEFLVAFIRWDVNSIETAKKKYFNKKQLHFDVKSTAWYFQFTTWISWFNITFTWEMVFRYLLDVKLIKLIFITWNVCFQLNAFVHYFPLYILKFSTVCFKEKVL